MKLRTVLVSAFALIISALNHSQAATIALGIDGDAEIGANYIDFGQYPTGVPYAPAPAYGSFEVSLVNAGLFESAGVTAGEFGMIESVNEGPGSITLPSAFMTFDTGGSNLMLWATNIPAGTVGPYSVIDTPGGVVLAFNVEGYITDSTDPTLNENFSGTFAATFSGETAAELFGSLPIDTPYSATFTVSTGTGPQAGMPEPAYLGLFGLGLLGLGVASRRLRNS